MGPTKCVSISITYALDEGSLIQREFYKTSGIIKDFTSEPGVPALQLSFVIIGIPKEEVKSEYTNDAEMVHIGMFVLQL